MYRFGCAVQSVHRHSSDTNVVRLKNTLGENRQTQLKFEDSLDAFSKTTISLQATYIRNRQM